MINLILIWIFSYFLASQRSPIGFHPNPCLCDVFPDKFAKTITKSVWVIQSRWHNWMWRPGESTFFFLNLIIFYYKIKVSILMWLACQKKSYLISDEIMNFWKLCNIHFLSSSCLCPVWQSQFCTSKKIRNRLREYSKIRNFVTYQITFLLTCQPHKGPLS